MFDDHENAKKHRADAKTTYAIKTGFDVLTTIVRLFDGRLVAGAVKEASVVFENNILRHNGLRYVIITTGFCQMSLAQPCLGQDNKVLNVRIRSRPF